MTAEQRDAKRAQYRRQFTELHEQPDVFVTCDCGHRLPVKHAYRCYFCGIWFCAKCAEDHFGPRPQHNEDAVGAST